MKKLLLNLTLCCFLLCSASLMAQDNDLMDIIETAEEAVSNFNDATAPTQTVDSQADEFTHKLNVLKENNLHIEVMAICTLCFLAILVNSILMYKKQKFDPEDLINANGLVLIVFGTILVIMIADTEQQLTAAVGILGAVAGYLFGTMKKDGEQAQPVEPPA